MSTQDDKVTFICRCEEITDEAIGKALIDGAATVDDVKRRTRAGMGTCQGIFCTPVIAAMVAHATGVPVDRVAPMTTRPPLRVIPLDALASLAESETDDDLTMR